MSNQNQINAPQYTVQQIDSLDAPSRELRNDMKPYGVVVGYKFDENQTREYPTGDLNEDYEEDGEEYVTVEIPVKKYKCKKTQKTIIERHAFQTVDKFVPYPTRPEEEDAEIIKLRHEKAARKSARAEAKLARKLNKKDIEKNYEEDPEYIRLREELEQLEIEGRTIVKPKVIKQRRRIVQMVPGEIETVKKEVELIEYKYEDRFEEVEVPVIVYKHVPRVVGIREIVKEEEIISYDPNVTEEDPDNIELVDYTTRPIADNFKIDAPVIPEVVTQSVIARKIPVWSGKTIFIEVPEEKINDVPVESITVVSPVQFIEVDEEDLTEEEKKAWYGDNYHIDLPEKEENVCYAAPTSVPIIAAGRVSDPPSEVSGDETEDVDSQIGGNKSTIGKSSIRKSSVVNPSEVIPAVPMQPSVTTKKARGPTAAELRAMVDEEADVVGVVSAQHPVVSVQYAQTAQSPVFYGSQAGSPTPQVQFNPHGAFPQYPQSY